MLKQKHITACIIQGNIRNNTSIVCLELSKKFDHIILSTWENEQIDFELPKNATLLLNKTPNVAGYNHRNYQRLSTAKGLETCKEIDVDFVMKWRTDMVPLNLNVDRLIAKALYNVPKNLTSRLVTCYFRCLTVEKDFLSSIPDLFAFGHISTMSILWGDEGFDYNKSFNSPKNITDKKMEAVTENNINSGYCPEAELYALFNERLEFVTKKNLHHEEILKNYFSLINHQDMDILWFGDKTFRPIISLYYPWWTIKHWNGEKSVTKMAANYPSSKLWNKVSPYIILLLTKLSIIKQKWKFNNYLKRLS
ncbi:WavE lipopolysaccharide synthesis family protein [Pedobacter arcticus]|uniref:WavE lipopolysaccharide synthesis family protein n=1 Tax=Pedobacter arcticus TaxID=752140 RepID=UPI00031100DC|nr:WavE lipopolysaccharide synthesis family protein [Pedobacter arcticus]